MRFWLLFKMILLEPRYRNKALNNKILFSIIYNLLFIKQNKTMLSKRKFNSLAPPRITLMPSRQVVHPGQNAFINCTTTGQQPITIDWLPIGRNMPASVYTSGGYITFNNIQLQDAGRYLCRARNNAGEAEATADVIVEGGVFIFVWCLPRC